MPLTWTRTPYGRYRSGCGRFDIRRGVGEFRGWLVVDRTTWDEVHTFTLATAKSWAEERAAPRKS